MHPQPPEDLAQLIEAFAHAAQAVLELGMTCHEDDFDQPTQCPGWTVKDQISHVVAGERAMNGDPQEKVPVPDYEWLRTDVGKIMEPGVEARRSRSGRHVVAELAALLPARLESLRDPGLDPQVEVDSPFGRLPLRRLLELRTVDVWCHEQDLRQALDRPGDLDTGGAALFVQTILTSFPARAARRADLDVGTIVIIECTGPVCAREGVRIIEGDHGKPYAESLFSGISHDVDVRTEPADAVTTIRLTTDALTRRGAGRVPTAQLSYAVEGDDQVAARVLDALVITP